LAEHTKIEETTGSCSKTTSLKQALDTHKGEVISLVGAGGKTTLMAALAKQLVEDGGSVITTTTTKIFDWQAPGSCLIVEADEERMTTRLISEMKKHRHITIVSQRLPAEGKLKGVSPQLIARIAELKLTDYIVIEADGAARRPLKAPNATEPVIPEETTLVVAVVGIDALNARLDREKVFRPEIVSSLTRLPLGSIITAGAIATLITTSDGITKGSPPDARIIPFINKVNSAKDIARAESLAHTILEEKHSRIERVVLGQAQSANPVIRVIQVPEC
jgi:probable selenium-dependent hydroxylase accessory protein YqeC